MIFCVIPREPLQRRTMTKVILCAGCKMEFAPNRRTTSNRVYCLECQERSRQRKYYLHKTVKAAVLGGKIPDAKTLPCDDCGATAYCYDHRDWTKPLLVAPVCRKCNRRRGSAENLWLVRTCRTRT